MHGGRHLKTLMNPTNLIGTLLPKRSPSVRFVTYPRREQTKMVRLRAFEAIEGDRAVASGVNPSNGLERSGTGREKLFSVNSENRDIHGFLYRVNL